jgi:hypothetical protein
LFFFFDGELISWNFYKPKNPHLGNKKIFIF